jgi:hypothetical protein
LDEEESAPTSTVRMFVEAKDMNLYSLNIDKGFFVIIPLATSEAAVLIEEATDFIKSVNSETH